MIAIASGFIPRISFADSALVIIVSKRQIIKIIKLTIQICNFLEKQIIILSFE